MTHEKFLSLLIAANAEKKSGLLYEGSLWTEESPVNMDSQGQEELVAEDQYQQYVNDITAPGMTFYLLDPLLGSQQDSDSLAFEPIAMALKMLRLPELANRLVENFKFHAKPVAGKNT